LGFAFVAAKSGFPEGIEIKSITTFNKPESATAVLFDNAVPDTVKNEPIGLLSNSL
jgi:hypothetical protein